MQPSTRLGWSFDVTRAEGALELRGSAYRTIVNHPLIVRYARAGKRFQLVNGDEPLRTQGIDALRAIPCAVRFASRRPIRTSTRRGRRSARSFGEDFEFDTTMRRACHSTPGMR